MDNVSSQQITAADKPLYSGVQRQQTKEGYDYVIYNCVDTYNSMVFGLGFSLYHGRVHSRSPRDCSYCGFVACYQWSQAALVAIG